MCYCEKDNSTIIKPFDVKKKKVKEVNPFEDEPKEKKKEAVFLL